MAVEKELDGSVLEILTKPEVRKEFKQNPRECLKKHNIKWSDDREIKVSEDTDKKIYFTIRVMKDPKLLDQIELPENLKKFYRELYQSPELRARLQRNPKEVFKSFNIDFPSDKEIIVLEDSDQLFNFVLPDSSEISEAELAQLAGGVTTKKSTSTDLIVAGVVLCSLNLFVGAGFIIAGAVLKSREAQTKN